MRCYDTQVSFEERLAKLRARYLGTMEDKAATIDRLVEALRDGDVEAAESLRSFAHQLVGSGASYGIPKISKAAEQLELADAEALPDKAEALRDTLLAVARENAD